MEFVRRFNIREGLVSLWSMHTTCTLFINEFQTALLTDIKRFLEQLVARDAEWHAQRSGALRLRPHERRLAPARDAAGPQPDAAGQRRGSRAGAVAADSDGRARRPARGRCASRSGDRLARTDGFGHRRSQDRLTVVLASNTRLPRGSRHRRKARRRRLDLEDGVRLFEAPDLLAVGALANRERERRHGARTYYNHNIRLEATNVCVASLSLLLVRAAEAGRRRRLHDVARAGLRQAARSAQRSAAHRSPHRQRPASRSAVQLLHGSAARAQGDPPGHSSEVLHGGRDRVLRRAVRHDRRAGAARADGRRPRLAARRRRGDLRRARAPQDLRTTSATPSASSTIHRIAHGLGMRSNVTMLYGHIETLEERVDHMLRARALQDETGGFQAFIPLAFHPDNNQMRKLPAPTRDRHAARPRRGAADARQHPAHQGVLDCDGRRGGADGAVVRRRRSRRHRAGRDASTTWPARGRRRP